ncbi:MAG: hypothetical protein OXU98_07830, partial [Gammaproteobacteria bacterium]|nr:hypothetical protein [Gammaproteobacteria bacterium]
SATSWSASPTTKSAPWRACAWAVRRTARNSRKSRIAENHGATHQSPALNSAAHSAGTPTVNSFTTVTPAVNSLTTITLAVNSLTTATPAFC